MVSAINQFNYGRIQWIDYARGIGIFLVVLGHVIRGLVNSSILVNTPLVKFVDQWIYAFHMPLFFILSGLLIEKSLRKPFSELLNDKLRTIVYPYFIWSILQSLLQIKAGATANKSMTIADIPKIIYEPVMQFWFLYTLFIILIGYALLRKAKVPITWLFLLSIVFYYLPESISLGSWSVIYLVRMNAIYFTLGALVGMHKLPDLDLVKPSVLCFFALAGFALVGLAVNFSLVTFSLKPPIAVTGSLACVAFAEILNRFNGFSFLRIWGQLSLEIYVAHTIASALVRIILQKVFGIEDLIIHLVLGVVSGIYIPLTLVQVAKHLHFPYLFTWPRSQTVSAS